MRIIFVDDRAQSFWLKEEMGRLDHLVPVAMTAEAEQAMSELGLGHRVIRDFGDTRPVSHAQASLCYQTFLIAREIEDYLDRATGTFSYITQAVYHLIHSINGIASRAHLMSQALIHLRPSGCLLFDGRPYGLASEAGHTCHPWLHILPQLQVRHGVEFKMLPAPPEGLYYRNEPFTDFDSSVLLRLKLKVPDPLTIDINGVGDLRLLFTIYAAYDWEPVVEALSKTGTQSFILPLDLSESQSLWKTIFLPELINAVTGERLSLDVTLPDQSESFSPELIERWERSRPMPPRIEAVGFDLFPAIRQELRTMCCTIPDVLHRSGIVAHAALKSVRPHAVCHWTLSCLSNRILNKLCAQQNIPSVVYQHGSGIPENFHRPQIDAKTNGADYYLTYGEAYSLLKNSPHPSHTKFVPVGSARLERLTVKTLLEPIPPCDRIRLMWVGDYSFGNTRSQDYSPEETARFQMEILALRILDDSGLFEIHYRPYPSLICIDGTSRWLETGGLKSVQLNTRQPFVEIVRMADLIVSINHSHTTWLESMVLNVPMLLYFNPDVFPAPVSEHTRTLLDESCWWCPTTDRFLQAVLRLAREGRTFIDHIGLKDNSRYIRECALHVGVGNIIPRVASFLVNVCKNGHALDEWLKDLDSPMSSKQVKP